MSFESPNQIPSQENRERESEYDPHLEMLWAEYGFPGHSPKAGSIAEKRLHDKCEEYANLRDRDDEYVVKDLKKLKTSDVRRRQLHNEISIMLVGQQRSGMQYADAEHIAGFAYEYIRGVTFAQMEKIKREKSI